MFQDHNPGTTTQAGLENNIASPLPEVPCPVLGPGSQTENIAHVDPDEPNTSDAYETANPVSFSKAQLYFGVPCQRL